MEDFDRDFIKNRVLETLEAYNVLCANAAKIVNKIACEKVSAYDIVDIEKYKDNVSITYVDPYLDYHDEECTDFFPAEWLLMEEKALDEAIAEWLAEKEKERRLKELEHKKSYIEQKQALIDQLQRDVDRLKGEIENGWNR